ncbi:hypothetical protein JKP88DRAFT_307229 [Tribonema minus]|uniref:Uncharacterized protein n=1 Tax=Tribonema minus TaxID=303371 RepID=A0A836CLA1_9STRA|nr:hypothetical protein JKP88DRAFT_307229 [Tribonema minus]
MSISQLLNRDAQLPVFFQQQAQASLVLLVAGFEDHGPQLFCSDPSVMFTRNKAIGSGSVCTQTNLQGSFSEKFALLEAEALAVQTLKQRELHTLLEAELMAAQTLKQVMEEEISKDNMEVASATKRR